VWVLLINGNPHFTYILNLGNQMSKLTDDEMEYVEAAIKAGTQSTEILNVLVITRSVMELKQDLVNAMEKPEHAVMPIYPRDIQTVYTMMKVEITNVNRKLQLGGFIYDAN
jgi:hypothetical protein